jgi:hypothetical protein
MGLVAIKIESKFEIEYEQLFNSLNELKDCFTQSIIKKQDEMIENAIRMSTPVIKGEITKGKIKWRGLRLVHKNTYGKIETWVEQRGVKISPSFIITCPDLFEKFNN